MKKIPPPPPTASFNSAEAIHFDSTAATKRKKHAVAISEFIAASTVLDTEIGLLLSRLLGPNAGPALAIYQSLRNTNSRVDAVMAAVGEVLSDDDKKMLRKLLSLADTAQKPRHRFAHWIWGYDKSDAAVLALLDPNVYLEAMSIGVHMKEGDRHDGGKLRRPGHVYLLTLEDIAADRKRLEAAKIGIVLFSHVATDYRLTDDPHGELVDDSRALLSRLLSTQESQESQAQAHRNKKEVRQRQREQSPKGSPSKASPRRKRNPRA